MGLSSGKNLFQLSLYQNRSWIWYFQGKSGFVCAHGKIVYANVKYRILRDEFGKKQQHTPANVASVKR